MGRRRMRNAKALGQTREPHVARPEPRARRHQRRSQKHHVHQAATQAMQLFPVDEVPHFTQPRSIMTNPQDVAIRSSPEASQDPGMFSGFRAMTMAIRRLRSARLRWNEPAGAARPPMMTAAHEHREPASRTLKPALSHKKLNLDSRIVNAVRYPQKVPATPARRAGIRCGSRSTNC